MPFESIQSKREKQAINPPGCALLFAVLLCGYLIPGGAMVAQSARTRALPTPSYRQTRSGELRLNYYYDRSGRWVKFSDWIPFKQKKNSIRFLEDYYGLYGLPHHYKTLDLKENIYYLHRALTLRFRHPRNALCKIESEPQYHKYRLLMHMKINMLIMRSYMRLASMYDKRHLYFHDLDFADDLEVSFLIARTYYREAEKYWKKTVRYARESHEYPFLLDLPRIESDRHQIMRRELRFGRIIGLHLERVESKMQISRRFLSSEGRPRPVKTKMQKDIEGMYDRTFKSDPLGKPVLNPEWKEKPLFPENRPLFEMKKP